MFDLFRSRAKAVRYLLGALLMLVALSMVVTLIPGFGGGGGRQDDNTVAEIGDYVLTARDINQRVQAAMRNRSFPREMAAFYVPQMIDSLITDYAVVHKAQQLGFRVSEEDLAKAIRSMFPQLFPGGQFAGKDAYAALLAQQNTTIPEFEANLRNQMLLMRMQGLAAEGIVVTPSEIEQEYRTRNEKVKLEYVALSADKLRPQVTVTPEEIAGQYQANKAQFTIPEKRSMDIIVSAQEKLAERITIPEADLRRAYESDKDRFRNPERVQVRHLLLTTTGKPAADVPKIQARAEELLKQIRAGANLGELATKYSEDPGSAKKGGNLGWVVRGQTVPAFEAAAFSLKQGEISNVIKTEYGFHILQVLSKEEARLKPFEEVKDQLAGELKRQQAIDMVQKLADEAHDELVRNPRQAQQVAAKLGLQYIHADKVGLGEPIPEMGVNRQIEDATGGLEAQAVSPVVQVGPESLAVAVVTEVVPSRPAELGEVQDQIRKQLTDQKVAVLLEQRGKEAFEQARSAGDLKAVAKSMGLEVKTTQEFSRNGAADGIGSASLLSDAFGKPVGAIVGPIASGEQRFVAKVAGHTPADMSQLASQRDQIRDVLKREKAGEQLQMFQESIRNALVREGEIKIHKDVVDRLTASYRG